MIKNYFTLILRNFSRNKGYAFINIVGLSIGITSCIIIFLVINYDLSFDKFHAKADNIYRIVQDSETASGTSNSAVTPYPLARAFRNDFPDVPLVTQMHFEGESVLTIGNDKQKIDDVLFADSLFFDVFDCKVLSGNPKVELGEPGKAFLTKSLADKILKGKETMHLKINKVELQVVGIVADPPPTSHIKFNMIVSMPSLTRDFVAGYPLDRWGLTARGYVYLALPEAVTPESINSRLKAFVEKYHPADEAKRTTNKLQPLRDIHFDQVYLENPGTSNVDLRDFIVMAVLGIFILFIACINFINLATALSEKKAKEIGVRKTLGAQRAQLTFYFLSETFLLTVFAVLLSLGATEWLLKWINPFLEKEVDFSLFTNPILAIFLLTLIVVTTLLAGFYPGHVLSRFNPTAVLKNSASPASSGTFVRKGLVVFQFLIAHVLIIGTLIVADQMKYFKDKPLGFDKEAIITMPLPDNKKPAREAAKGRMEAIAGIESVSLNVGAPVSSNSFHTGFYLTEQGPEQGTYNIDVKTVDVAYLSTYNITVAGGRWFTEADERLSDPEIPEEQRKYVYILNKAAARKLGFNDPQEIIGKQITTGIGDLNAEVVGVLDDFHSTSLHEEIRPIVFVTMPNLFYEIGVKIKTENLKETLARIETSWKELFPNDYFEYEFLDDHLASLYENDQKTFTLFKIFAGVSIFIGCLGLYGLISFVANQKRKEVGIRKVMGASVSSILVLFSKEFVRLIIIAFALAIPLTWYFMNLWLQSFAYKVDISWIIFLAGFISILVIVLLTIAYRSFVAARANPAITLRSE